MNKYFHIQLIIFMLGFFATPMLGYGCGKNVEKVEKTSCSLKKIIKSSEKDCCKSHSSNEKSKDCNGKCKNTSCQCSNSCYSFFSTFITLKNTNKFFIDSSKQKFYHREAHLSPGFVSIWTPPNIG
ncbi:hypothetical protein [uncultured Flavobacterium sp.]|uniref:hypothetical protein n=1 Tax=uncultured Flavobacterium sp. TaxID=165435 RepID=UPI0025F1F31D|nr:hypothetical protein [uncultured Flavobacterium sp.]